MSQQKPINAGFFLLFIPVAYGTYIFHEFGHWSVGEILGNRMLFSLNYVSPRQGFYIRESHDLYVSLGGPAFSVIQASIALLVVSKFKALHAYPFAFFPMFNRFFSLLLGGFGKQDEARISILLGTGEYLVAIIVLGILLAIVVRSSYILGFDVKTNGYAVTVSTLCQLMVIATYEFLGV
jgi:hypothetical protein